MVIYFLPPGLKSSLLQLFEASGARAARAPRERLHQPWGCTAERLLGVPAAAAGAAGQVLRLLRRELRLGLRGGLHPHGPATLDGGPGVRPAAGEAREPAARGGSLPASEPQLRVEPGE